MAAIVLKDKQSPEEKTVDQEQGHGQPAITVCQKINRDPYRQERDQRVDELPGGDASIRQLIRYNELGQSLQRFFVLPEKGICRVHSTFSAGAV